MAAAAGAASTGDTGSHSCDTSRPLATIRTRSTFTSPTLVSSREGR